MFINESFSDKIHGLPEPPTSIGTNEGPGMGGLVDGLELQHGKFQKFRLEDEELYWQANENAGEFWQRVVGVSATVTRTGVFYGSLMIETFLLSEAYDSARREKVLIRRRIVGRSLLGEPIYPVRWASRWKFLLHNHPDPQKVAASEYERLLKDHADVIAEEQRVCLEDDASAAAANAIAARARLAAENPTAALAAGISEGVAAALAQLPRKE